MTRVPGLVGLCAVLIPGVVRAQQRMQFTAGGFAAQEIMQSHIDVSSTRFTGLMLGLEGGLTSDRLVVRIRYAEGRVNPSSTSSGGLSGALGGTSQGRDVVEGEAMFGFRAVDWLTIWGGPSARAYTVGDADQRWLVWTARATARGTLIPGRMQTFVELWGAVSGNVGNPPTNAGGRGANGGLELRLGETSQLWGRLGYRIESTHAEGLRETAEALTLSVSYGLPL
jgi:hypothetical protein